MEGNARGVGKGRSNRREVEPSVSEGRQRGDGRAERRGEQIRDIHALQSSELLSTARDSVLRNSQCFDFRAGTALSGLERANLYSIISGRRQMSNASICKEDRGQEVSSANRYGE